MKRDNYYIQQVANMELVDDYKKVIQCLGKLIELTERCNLKRSLEIDRKYHTSTVQIFVQEIISYIHEAYDCMRVGQLRAANMLLRAVIENYFSLSVIDRNQDKYLAELWQINSILLTKKITSNNNTLDLESLKIIAESYGLDVETIQWKKLRQSYGWLYPVLSGNTNVLGMCKYLGQEYMDIYNNDYRMLSEFVHSSSCFQKEDAFTFDISLVSILVRMMDSLMRVSDRWLEVNQNVEKQRSKFWWILKKKVGIEDYS